MEKQWKNSRDTQGSERQSPPHEIASWLLCSFLYALIPFTKKVNFLKRKDVALWVQLWTVIWQNRLSSPHIWFFFSFSSFWKSWTEVTNVASEHGVENSYTASGSAKELSLFSFSLKTLFFFLMTQMIRWTRRHFFIFTYANSILYRTSHPLQILIPQEAKTACQAELVGRNGEHPHHKVPFPGPTCSRTGLFPPQPPSRHHVPAPEAMQSSPSPYGQRLGLQPTLSRLSSLW